MRVRLCDELPVAIGPEIEWPLTRRENLGNVVVPACFDEKDTHAEVLGKPARQGAAC